MSLPLCYDHVAVYILWRVFTDVFCGLCRVGHVMLSLISMAPIHASLPPSCCHACFSGRKLGDTDNLVTAKIRTSMIIQFMIRPLRDADGNPIPITYKGEGDVT